MSPVHVPRAPGPGSAPSNWTRAICPLPLHLHSLHLVRSLVETGPLVQSMQPRAEPASLGLPSEPHPHPESAWPLNPLPSPHPTQCQPTTFPVPRSHLWSQKLGAAPKGTWKTRGCRTRTSTSGLKVAGTEGTFWSQNSIGLSVACPVCGN